MRAMKNPMLARSGSSSGPSSGSLASLLSASLSAALLAATLAVAPPVLAQTQLQTDARETIRRAVIAGRANPEDARRLAEEALALLSARPDPDLEVRSNLVLCDYYSERDLARARELLERSMSLLSLTKRSGLRAGVLSCEGEIHESAGENAKAMGAYERAVSSAEAAGDVEMLANALFQRGWLRGVQGEFALGLIDLRRSLALFEKEGFAEHARTALNGIASIYNRMGDHAQAVRFFEVALRAQLHSGALREAVVTLFNMGRSLENLNQWDNAQKNYLQAMEISRQLGYARGEAYALRGLAGVHNARGEWPRSLERVAVAERLIGGLPDAPLRAHLALQRGIALRGLKRPAEAIASLNAAFDTFSKAESFAELATTHATLAGAYADSGDWRSAYEQQRRLKEVSDLLHTRQLDQRFTTLKVEFDTATRDKENALLMREKAATEAALEQQKRAGKLQVIVIALAGLLAAVLGGLAWRHRRASRTAQTLAMTDELTGLPNRRAILACLTGLIDAGRACAVMIVDIDHFKNINDQQGHLIGDDVLRAVATVLKEIVREPVVAGRLGGEEFLLVLPDADLDAAMHLAERVRDGVAKLDTSRWFSGRAMSVSVGVSVAAEGSHSVAEALRRADDALYEAKAAGRDRVHAHKLVRVA